MSRVLLNLAVFTLGVGFAALFALRERLLSPNAITAPSGTVQIERLTLPTKLEPDASRLAYAKERRAVLARAVDSKNRISVLSRALDEGERESLELLRTDFLEILPDYQTALLPKLKRAALEALFRRFTDRDWREWPSLVHDSSEARAYVDSVASVNTALGNFLETAGHLLHGMYVSIASGEVYRLDEDLLYLLQNAGEILRSRSETGGGASSNAMGAASGETGGTAAVVGTKPEVFDVAFIRDPAVALTFERIKTELTKQFVAAQPSEIAAQVRLLSALDPRAVDRTSAHAFASILRTLSLKASVQFRADIFPDLVDSVSLESWAKADPVVAQPLAELYLVGALDALEIGRTSLAKKLLDRSDRTFPGLRARAAVESYYQTVLGQPPTQIPIDPATLIDLKPEPAAAAPAPSNNWLFSLIKWSLLLIVAVTGVRAFLVYLARQQDAAYAANLPTRYEPPTKDMSPRMTDPSDVTFEIDEDPSELDLGFDQDVVNR